MAKKSRYDIIVKASTSAAQKSLIAVRATLRGLALTSIVIPIKIARRGFDIAVGAIKRAISNLASFAKRTLQIGVGLVGAGGVVAAKAFSDLELLKLRLEASSSSSKQAAKDFQDIFDFSTRTPFDPQQLVSAFSTLQGFGAASIKNIEAIGSAAFASGKQIQDVVAGIGALSREVFIPLGIDLRNELLASGQAFVKFRNKAGKEISLTATSAEELRQRLIEAFNAKFGGSLEKAAETVSGLVSTVRGNLSIAFAEVGEGFSTQLKSALKTINEFLVRLRESGVAFRIGELAGIALEKAGNALTKALPSLVRGGARFARILFVTAGAIVDAAKGFSNAISGANGTSIGDAILSALKAGTNLLLDAFILIGKTLSTTLVSVGKIIGSVLKQEILNLPIPGFGKALREDAKKGIRDVSDETASGLVPLIQNSINRAFGDNRQLSVFGGNKFKAQVEALQSGFSELANLDGVEKIERAKFLFQKAIDLDLVNESDLKKFALLSRDNSIRNTLSNFESKIRDGGKQFSENAKEEFNKFSEDFQEATGVDLQDGIKRRSREFNKVFNGFVESLRSSGKKLADQMKTDSRKFKSASQDIIESSNAYVDGLIAVAARVDSQFTKRRTRGGNIIGVGGDIQGNRNDGDRKGFQNQTRSGFRSSRNRSAFAGTENKNIDTKANEKQKDEVADPIISKLDEILSALDTVGKQLVGVQ